MSLHFWLLAMDAVDLAGRMTDRALRRLYLWCVGKASDATDWGGR